MSLVCDREVLISSTHFDSFLKLSCALGSQSRKVGWGNELTQREGSLYDFGIGNQRHFIKAIAIFIFFFPQGKETSSRIGNQVSRIVLGGVIIPDPHPHPLMCVVWNELEAWWPLDTRYLLVFVTFILCSQN